MLASLCLWPGSATSETLSAAIARTVSINPTLRAQRARVQATSEKLSQATSGFFPKISASADYGRDIDKVSTPSSIDFNLLGDGTTGITPNAATQTKYKTFPRGLGIQATQSLFDGGKTFAAIGEAKSLTAGAGEGLRGLEQDTIIAAVSAYTNVIRAREILRSRKDNVAFLSQQLRLLRARHDFGDVTGSDLALTDSRLADAKFRLAEAESFMAQANAVYVQTTGGTPDGLVAAAPIDRILPRTLDEALSFAQQSHPSLLFAEHAIGAAKAQVRMAEADFYPTIGVSASMSRRDSIQTPGDRVERAYVVGKLNIPLFDGGLVAGRTRESRAVVAQRDLERDAARDLVRSRVHSTWSNLEAARSQLRSAEQQARAAFKAASAMAEQYRIGERSLTDVLLGQLDLASARENFATAKRDRVIASFAVAQAAGVLNSAAVLTDLEGERPVSLGDGFKALTAVSRVRKAEACLGCAESPDDWSLRNVRSEW